MRSGILPVLRSQWRADQASAADKLETRLDKRLASLKEQLDRVAVLADKVQSLEALAGAAERITNVDREVRMLRATLAHDIADRQRGPHRPGVFDGDRVVAHVERAIASARIESDPSVHIVVNDLTPADTYQAILDGIPPPIFFSQRDNTKQNLKLSMLAIAPAWTLETLGFVENTLIPRMMVPALLRKFEPHIRDFYLREYGPERGPALAAIPHEATGGRLMLRRPGYHLDPHLDPKRVVFTCLLYFARPGDSEAFGIACDLVKMVPFKPNSAVAFLNWGGAHGADIPKNAPGETERYSYQFYVSPDPAALSALVGETESAIAE